MSASAADLDAAIDRLGKAMGGLEARVRDLKAKAEAAPARGGDDDLFAAPGDSARDSAREKALEAAGAEASAALAKAASEIRAVLEGA